MSQRDFTEALLDPARPPPPGLVDPAGRPAGRRFDIYRNNVTLSLIEALESGFPATAKLLGEDGFRYYARLFARAHPPSSPVLMLYGEGFAEFLADTEPAQRYGFLPDTARLELAIRQSYHSADAAPIDPAALAAMPPDRLMAARIVLAPSLRLVRSPWPIHAIWRANMADGPTPAMRAEDVLVTRPQWDPAPQLLPPRGAEFVAALVARTPFGEAAEAAAAVAGETFELGAILQLLIANGAIAAIEDPAP
jgi:Putative DNA-binding domain